MQTCEASSANPTRQAPAMHWALTGELIFNGPAATGPHSALRASADADTAAKACSKL